MTWQSALLALLLFSGSLYAQGQPNHQPGFEQIKEGDNPVYISTIGVTEIPEKSRCGYLSVNFQHHSGYSRLQPS